MPLLTPSWEAGIKIKCIKNVKKIVIAGGGGFGWELADYMRHDIEKGLLIGVSMKGVIDDQTESAFRAPIGLPYIGTIASFKPESDDYLLIAIGNPNLRKQVYERLQDAGCRFTTYIHPSVYLAASATVMNGVIVCPGSVINAGAFLDVGSVINVCCSIGHGAVVGKHSVLSPYSALNGDAVIGELCFLGTRATIFPGVKVGDNCTVDSHSYVKKSVEHNRIITTRGNYKVLPKRIK